MESEDYLTQYMRETMLDIISALYLNGIRQVHLGGMMRLLGLPDSIAAQYDEDRMEITQEFAVLMERNTKASVPVVPEGSTIH